MRPSPATSGAARRRAAARRFLAQRGIPARHGAGHTPNGSWLRARTALAAATPSGLSAAWTPLGPAQTITPAYGAVTGRVTGIAVDVGADATGNTVYVGTTGGGVWKSTNAAGAAAAVRFVPLTDTLAAQQAASIGALSIGAITVQPGGTGVVLAGTGDPNDALDSYYGEGILRSTDGGSTWSLIDEADTGFGVASPHSFQGEGFAGFAWSTASAGVVVAAVTQAFDGVVVNALARNSEEGLYYSTDAGATWQLATIEDGPGQVVQGPGSVQVPVLDGIFDGNAATAVVWNPVRQIFIAVIRYHGYYESQDGVTWTRLAQQPGTGMGTSNCPTNPGAAGAASCPVFRGALAVQPLTGDTFAMTVDPNDLDQGLWRDTCTVNGNACAAQVVPTFATQIDTTALEDGTGAIAQGDYDLWLAAIPAAAISNAGGTDTLLYVGTEDIWKRSLAASNVPWLDTTNWATCALPMGAGVAPSQHAVGVGLGPILFFGNDSGLWRTTDGINEEEAVCSADDAAHFDNLNSALGSLAEVTDFAGDPGAAGTLLAAQGVNGTAATTHATANGAWPQVLDGYGAYVAIDPANTQNWYASAGYSVSVYLCTAGAACDAAGFPLGSLVGDGQTEADGESLENPAVWMLDPQDSSQMIVGTCRVWQGSVAGGSAPWTTENALSLPFDVPSDPDCTGQGQVRALSAGGSVIGSAGGSSSTAPEILYAGMAGTWDGGQTATGHVYTASVGAGATGVQPWTDIWASPVANDTGNGGQFNPGGFAISAVVADPHDASGQTVYATVQGISGNATSEPTVYRSSNQGQSWTNITSNLPLAPVNALLVDPGDADAVYVATDAGVYVTTEVALCGVGGAACWNLLGTGLPDAPVTALAAWRSGSAGVLRAATYGRGIWQTGLVSAQPLTAVTVSPGALTFADQQVQTASTAQTVTVTNTVTVPFTEMAAASVSQDAGGHVDFAETDTCASSVAVSESCVVTVTFTPTTTGPLTAVLTLIANVPGGQVTIPLAGTGTAAGAVVLAAGPLGSDSLTFAPTLVGTTSVVQYVTVSNTGTVAVALGTPAASGDYQIATAVSSPCPASLPANTGCTVGVAFAPTKRGADNGTFSIIAGQTTLTATLLGTGLAAATDGLSPASLQFGSLAVGAVSAPQTVTVSNAGDASLTLSAISETADLTVEGAPCVLVAAGGSCGIAISFTPTAAGTRVGTLSVSDSLGKVQTVALSGTGLAAAVGGGGFTFTLSAALGESPVRGGNSETVLSGGSATYEVNVTDTGTTGGAVTLACTGAPSGYGCTATAGLTTGSVTLKPGQTSPVTVTLAPAASAELGTRDEQPWAWAGFMLAVVLPMCGGPSRKNRWLRAMMPMMLLALLAGCGTKATGGGSGGGGGGGTSSAPYTVTLTASAPGVNAQTATMTLLVEQ